MSTLNTVNITNGTDSITVEGAVKGSAKAWVNFNGTGTVAIRASYNVSSITDNGTGQYTVNFTTAMPDANYAVAISGRKFNDTDDGNFVATTGTNTTRVPSTTSCPITTVVVALALSDFPSVYVAIFR